jgi:hypothetical protein
VYILGRSALGVTVVINVSWRKVILTDINGPTLVRSLTNVKFAVTFLHRKEVSMLIDVCILERNISNVRFVANILLVPVIL